MIQQSYSGIVLMVTYIVLGYFDENGCCEVVIVSERGFEVQKSFVVIAETFFGGPSIKGDIAKCVIESS